MSAALYSVMARKRCRRSSRVGSRAKTELLQAAAGMSRPIAGSERAARQHPAPATGIRVVVRRADFGGQCASNGRGGGHHISQQSAELLFSSGIAVPYVQEESRPVTIENERSKRRFRVCGRWFLAAHRSFPPSKIRLRAWRLAPIAAITLCAPRGNMRLPG